MMVAERTYADASAHRKRGFLAAIVGDLAPEFSLRGTTGPGLDLAEIRGTRRAALFFYPADRTAG